MPGSTGRRPEKKSQLQTANGQQYRQLLTANGQQCRQLQTANGQQCPVISKCELYSLMMLAYTLLTFAAVSGKPSTSYKVPERGATGKNVYVYQSWGQGVSGVEGMY